MLAVGRLKRPSCSCPAVCGSFTSIRDGAPLPGWATLTPSHDPMERKLCVTGGHRNPHWGSGRQWRHSSAIRVHLFSRWDGCFTAAQLYPVLHADWQWDWASTGWHPRLVRVSREIWKIWASSPLLPVVSTSLRQPKLFLDNPCVKGGESRVLVEELPTLEPSIASHGWNCSLSSWNLTHPSACLVPPSVPWNRRVIPGRRKKRSDGGGDRHTCWVYFT